MATISPTEAQVNAALVSYLASVLPAGSKIIKGQVNRAAEPTDINFVVYWPIRAPRLATNVDASQDVSFMGSIAGNTLTVSQVLLGTILLNSFLFGQLVAVNTKILTQLTGPAGGVGTYAVDTSQTVTSSKMASGARSQTQSAEAVIQLDVHGPLGGDWSKIISTTFRDNYGVDFFTNTGLPIAPLYVEDPHQVPFINGEQQYEDRWVVTLVLQVNWTVSIAQQYADVLSVTLLNVETEFPT